MSEFSSLYIKTRVVTFCVVTFRVKEVVTFCVEKLLQFRPMLHFASKVVTFCVNVTFCVSCYTLRRKPHIYKISYFIGTGEEPERSGESLI